MTKQKTVADGCMLRPLARSYQPSAISHQLNTQRHPATSTITQQPAAA